MDSSENEIVRPLKRFRKAKSKDEEEVALAQAVPASTRYKKKWCVNMFENWRADRVNKITAKESTIFNVRLFHLENLDSGWESMSAPSLNFWIGKFIQEAADKQDARRTNIEAIKNSETTDFLKLA
ncbi:predicted protein [Nematostella vectensis]|uniref:Uncharacterized protein n=1 Tax=Nematostella vectensis TaxID=45351 RepID=A7RJV8_NEMVE|nr:predicted protein [Nematostella vectensis]|eukprot:XP_001640405.1 predicted protein [Nematostella vectensis]